MLTIIRFSSLSRTMLFISQGLYIVHLTSEKDYLTNDPCTLPFNYYVVVYYITVRGIGFYFKSIYAGHEVYYFRK